MLPRLEFGLSMAHRAGLALMALCSLAVAASAQTLTRPRTGGEILAAPTTSTARPTRASAPLPGPAPTLWAIEAWGTRATLRWAPVADAASYVVTRSFPAKPDCCALNSGPLTVTRWDDNALLLPGEYVYGVYVNYTDGRQGYAELRYTRPPAQDPTGFVATATGAGEATLQWNPVTGISQYVVRGPGTGPGGVVASGTTLKLNDLPASGTPLEWTVASLYGQQGAISDPAAWPKASAQVETILAFKSTLFVQRDAVMLGFDFNVARNAASFRIVQIDPNNQTSEPTLHQGARTPLGAVDRVNLRIFPQLVPERPYRYQVHAVMTDGSSYTGPITTVTLPMFLVRTILPISNDRIVLDWNSFGSPPYVIKKGSLVQQAGVSALVFEEIRDQAGNVIQISGRQYQDMLVQRGVKYYYQVCATVSSGVLCPGVEATLP